MAKEGIPNSYKDPFWSGLAMSVEKRLDLPDGLLQSVVSKGERSNADQVSEAGAKTPFQIIPSTRKSVMDKYGIDAYLNPQNAAEAAGLLLKESLERNKGDTAAAVAEYHGGTDRKNWGRRTKDYVTRVLGFGEPQQQAMPQDSGQKKSAFQIAMQSKAKSDQGQNQNAISNIYSAYSDGRMSPEQAADFEADVNSGVIMLPRGASLKSTKQNISSQQSIVLPESIVNAYNTGKMDKQQMSELEADINSGAVTLPSGAALAQKKQEGTTASGIAGAMTRSLALPAAGAGAGFALGGPPGALAGAGIATLAQTIGDPIVGGVNALLGTNFTKPTDAVENLLTRVGVPIPKTEAERIVQAATQGVASASGMVSAGKTIAETAASPIAKAVGKSLASQPVAQIAGGAASGAAAQAASEAGALPEAQLAAGLLGGVAGGALAASKPKTVLQTIKSPQIPAQIVKDAERAAVPLLTSDISPPTTFAGKMAQKVGERVPFVGTGPVRAEQQKLRAESVKNFLQEFGVVDDMDNISANIVKDLSKNRSDDIAKYAAMKREVIDNVAPKGAVPMNNTLNKIDELVLKLEKENTIASKEAADILKEIKAEGPSGISGRSIDQLEAFRRDVLANAFKDDPSRPVSVATRTVGEKAIRALYDPVRRDMIDFIKTNGDTKDVSKFMIANKRLEQMSSDLNSSTLKSVLRTGDVTPETVNKLLFSQKPSDINRLYKGLSENGRANARAAILDQAAKTARTESGFSPDKFLNGLKRLDPQLKVFFKGDDFEKAKGLARVLESTKRAGAAGVSTSSGQEAMPFVAGGLLTSMLGAAPAVAAAGGIGAAARIYESAPVRNLLIKIAQTKKGSSQEQLLTKQLLLAIQAQQNTKEAKNKTQKGE